MMVRSTTDRLFLPHRSRIRHVRHGLFEGCIWPAFRLVLCTAAFFSCLWYTLPASAQTFENERGHVEFKSSIPLRSFTGKSDDLVGRINLADSTIDFYVDLTTLKSGIGKLDKDMRITLDTEQYPFAEFFGKLVTPYDPDEVDPQRARVQGIFGLHGVSREIEVEGTLTSTPDGILLEAAWSLQLKDYGIKPPKLLFIKVSQTQKISISTELSPTPQ